MSEGGFTSVNERVDAHKIRQRSNSFRDHFSQARLFYKSQTETEQAHHSKAFRFELGKVETTEVRVRMLGLSAQVDKKLAEKVAEGLGAKVPEQPELPMNHGAWADDRV